MAEKERRSGSKRTVQTYSRMLFQFFGALGKTPDQVAATKVFGYAHGGGLSGQPPSSVTIGARVACVSSFIRFLIRMGLLAANPRDALERPRAVLATPRGRTAGDIQKLLRVIPETPVGLRDRAINLFLTLTGQRRTEVLSLKVGGQVQEGDTAYYRYRGKGNKTGKRGLPQPAYQAKQVALAAFSKDLATRQPNQAWWPSSSDGTGGITSGTFYGELRRYLKAADLPQAEVQVFRHAAAKLSREAGDSVEQVSRFWTTVRWR